MIKSASQAAEVAWGVGAPQAEAAERGKGAPASKNEAGMALVIALMAMLLLMALGLTLVLNTATEAAIAGHFRVNQEALYAADAGLERVMDELGSAADWNAMLRGVNRSAFVDGAPSGARTLSDGSTIDLAKATNLLNCGHAGSCTAAEMDASTADRPWGVNNPRWSLYAFGLLSTLVSTGTINSNMYVAVWVSDDQSDNDNDPTTDGDDASNPGRGVITIHAEAFGPAGTHKVLEATVGRPASSQPAGGIRMIAWREIR